MLNKIKQMLAHILFYLGDKVSLLLIGNVMSYALYPVYNKLMLWSSTLDVNEEIWHESQD